MVIKKNNQLKNEINANPRKTSFYKAMKLCVGVLLVLDQEATPFTRSLGSFGENVPFGKRGDGLVH